MSDLSYHLDYEVTGQKSYLIVKFEKPIDHKQLLALATKEIATFLFKEQLHFLNVAPLSPSAPKVSLQKVYIRKEHAKDAIMLLGPSGKLHWKGKKLIIDPFTSFNWVYEAEEKEGELQVKGNLVFLDKPVSVKEDDFFFPSHPAFVIQGGVFRTLHEDCDSGWIARLFGKTITLNEKEKKDFLEDCTPVVWKSLPKDEIDIFPFLVLKDRSGAFADLWMDYGKGKQVAYHDPVAASWRDKAKEKSWEKDLFETDFLAKVVGTSHYYCPLDKVGKSLSFLLEIGWKVVDYQNKNVLLQKEAKLDIDVDEKSFYLKGKVDYGDYKADLTSVVGSFNRRERFVSLSASAVGLIDEGPLQEVIEISENSEGGAFVIEKKKFGLLQGFFPEEKAQEKISYLPQLLKNFSDVKQVSIGERFAGKLYPYQQEGVNWLSFLYEMGFHGLLADEMGLGKTVQLLAFFSRLELSSPILIVVPTSLIFHWKAEIEKFLPGQEVYVHNGTDRTGDVKNRKGIIVTSYSLLRIDEEIFKEIEYECVILDEAQVIKNPDSQIARTSLQMRARFRLAVTGTPVENAWQDLWSLFSFLMPGLLDDRKEFLNKMSYASEDVRYLRQVKKKLAPFIKRRLKTIIGDQLPEKCEQTIWVEMSLPQKTLYEEYLAKNRKGILKKIQIDKSSASRMEILEAILRLRQICCHPLLVDGSFSPVEASGKYERVLEDLENVVAEGRKVLLYSQFTQMLKIFEKDLQDKNISYAYLDGSTKDRKAEVDRFQEDPSVQVFLISLKAGGVGLNLTAADYVFLYDPWWNEAAEKQAMDRAHRIGRKDTVIVRRYVTAMSIEEKIMKIKDYKRALSDSLFEENFVLESLSLDEWCELLS